MKTKVVPHGTTAVWVPQTPECEYLIDLDTGNMIGHIHRDGGLWNGFWLRASARRSEETRHFFREENLHI